APEPALLLRQGADRQVAARHRRRGPLIRGPAVSVRAFRAFQPPPRDSIQSGSSSQGEARVRFVGKRRGPAGLGFVSRRGTGVVTIATSGMTRRSGSFCRRPNLASVGRDWVRCLRNWLRSGADGFVPRPALWPWVRSDGIGFGPAAWLRFAPAPTPSSGHLDSSPDRRGRRCRRPRRTDDRIVKGGGPGAGRARGQDETVSPPSLSEFGARVIRRAGAHRRAARRSWRASKSIGLIRWASQPDLRASWWSFSVP